jgi:hypothetical protein
VLVFGVERAHRLHALADEQCVHLGRAGVTHRVYALSVAQTDRHLQRIANVMMPADLLDEAAHALECGQRFAFQTESQGQVKQQLGVVVPSIFGNSFGSTAKEQLSVRSLVACREPLCTKIQCPYRNGLQFVSCTAQPVVARICAMKISHSMCAQISRKLRSLHAGVVLRYKPGEGKPSY